MQRKEQQRRARDAQLVGPSTQPGRLSKTLMSEYSNTEQIQVIEFCYSGCVWFTLKLERCDEKVGNLSV